MNAPPKAVVIAVGSEMLTPSRTDTNSLFVTEVLNALGIDVAYKAIVGDDRAELASSVEQALERHRILILTGGLGPTDDDLTREVVAAHFDLPLEEDPAIVESIRARFAARGLAMPEVNRRQAMVPQGARVIDNPRGSAPGLLIDVDDRVVALLPGPPREMKPMMSGPVREHLLPLAGERRLLRRVLRLTGRSESRVEERVQPLYRGWLAAEPRIETTILASPGFVELHLSTQVSDETAGARALNDAVLSLTATLGADVVSTDGASLEQTVGTMLRDRGWRIALAESCTGGLATSRLTDVPGSSDYVDRSWVVYSNAAKHDQLGVPESLLAEHGAVSELVAQALAEGALARSQADVGVGITGIAGPGGGTDEKPVGMVWIAVAVSKPRETRTALCRFLGGREMVKIFAAVAAIDFVRRWLLDAPWDIDWIWRRAADAADAQGHR
jgi:nicotinamide-nucleotide amidase